MVSVVSVISVISVVDVETETRPSGRAALRA